MNVEIGTAAAQISDKEYMNGISIAVHSRFRPKVTIRPVQVSLWVLPLKKALIGI